MCRPADYFPIPTSCTGVACGSVNDLQSATQQLPNGTGGWNPVAVDYYRYWLSGSSTGFAHGLKMHFGPEAYRLIFNAGIDIETAGKGQAKGPHGGARLVRTGDSKIPAASLAASEPACRVSLTEASSPWPLCLGGWIP